MEYVKRLDIIKEGKERIVTDGIDNAIEWTAKAVEAEMQKEIDHLLKKVSIRDKIIFQMQEFG